MSKKAIHDCEENAPITMLFPRHGTSWHKLKSLAYVIKNDDRMKPVFVLATKEVSAYATECDRLGFDYLEVHSEIEHTLSVRSSWIHACLATAEAWAESRPRLGNWLPVALARIAHMRRQLVIECQVFNSLLERIQPRIVLMPGDRELSPVPSMLAACRKNGIPTVLAGQGVPFGEGVARARTESSNFRVEARFAPPLLNLLAAAFFPKQVKQTNHGKLLFSPGWRIFTLASLSMLSQNPWIQGGGYGDFVLQSDKPRMQGYLEMGVPKSKLVLVGDHELDPLYHANQQRDQYREDLRKKYSFTDGFIVIVSVPNDAEHNNCDWSTHLARQEEYFSYLFDCGMNVILSLHPKSDAADYAVLIDKFPFEVSDVPLTQLLPAADLFICSNSSTILWAKLCGIPSINLDYLHLSARDLCDPNVRSVHNPAAFREALAEIKSSHSHNFLVDFPNASSASSTDALFDGRSGDRICSLLLELSRKGTTHGGTD